MIDRQRGCKSLPHELEAAESEESCCLPTQRSGKQLQSFPLLALPQAHEHSTTSRSHWLAVVRPPKLQLPLLHTKPIADILHAV